VGKYLIEMAESRGFVDPLTRLTPRRETEFSSVLAAQHQLGRVRWNRVPLQNYDGSISELMAHVILQPSDVVVTEFRLLASEQAHIERWGLMPADFVFLARDLSRVLLVESKIGAPLSYAKDPRTEFGRQIDFLAARRDILSSYLLLVAGRLWDRGKYKKELIEAVERAERRPSVGVFVARWESVLAAFESQ
jgi:hypothetical protein